MGATGHTWPPSPQSITNISEELGLCLFSLVLTSLDLKTHVWLDATLDILSMNSNLASSLSSHVFSLTW